MSDMDILKSAGFNLDDLSPEQVEAVGTLSRDELPAHFRHNFDRMDTNKDGKLSLEEFIKVAEPPFSSDVPNGPTLE